MKVLLGKAIFAILIAATFGKLIYDKLGIIGTILTFGARIGIAVLIFEGIAVDQRYKLFERIIEGYSKSISDFNALEKEFPF